MRKRIVVLILAAAIAAGMNGCGIQKNDAADNPKRFRLEAGGNQIGVWLVTDRETGVQYLINAKGGAVMLTDKDGNPYIANGWRDYE